MAAQRAAVGDLAAVWDRQAPTYDARSAWLERRLLRPMRAWACAQARGQTLDVAMGTGANLAHYPPGVRVTGVDVSGGMLEQARHRRPAAGVSVVELRRADAALLPFRSAHFDTVVCTYALCSLPDEAVALAEMLRVLRPGGSLLLADHVIAQVGGARLLQRVLEPLTLRHANEHLTRRPLDVLRSLSGSGPAGPCAQIIDTRRRAWGVVEGVHARRTT